MIRMLKENYQDDKRDFRYKDGQLFNKAPVDTISINDLNPSKKKKVKNIEVNKFSYAIKVAEFYFFENAKDIL